MTRKSSDKAYLKELKESIDNNRLSTFEMYQSMVDREWLKRDFEMFVDLSAEDGSIYEKGVLYEDSNAKPETFTKAIAMNRAGLFRSLKLDKDNHIQAIFDKNGNQKHEVHDSSAKSLVDYHPAMFMFLKAEQLDNNTEKNYLRSYPEHFSHASKALRTDKAFTTEILKQYPHAIGYASNEIKNDLATALMCVKADPSSIHNAGPAPYEIYKKAGYGEKGLAALEKAVMVEKLYKGMDKRLAAKPEKSQSHQRKI